MYAWVPRAMGIKRLQFADAYYPLETSSKATGTKISPAARRCDGVAGDVCLESQHEEQEPDLGGRYAEHSSNVPSSTRANRRSHIVQARLADEGLTGLTRYPGLWSAVQVLAPRAVD